MADGVSGSMRSLRQGMPFCVPSWVLCLLSGNPPPPVVPALVRGGGRDGRLVVSAGSVCDRLLRGHAS